MSERPAFCRSSSTRWRCTCARLRCSIAPRGCSPASQTPRAHSVPTSSQQESSPPFAPGCACMRVAPAPGAATRAVWGALWRSSLPCAASLRFAIWRPSSPRRAGRWQARAVRSARRSRRRARTVRCCARYGCTSRSRGSCVQLARCCWRIRRNSRARAACHPHSCTPCAPSKPFLPSSSRSVPMHTPPRCSWPPSGHVASGTPRGSDGSQRAAAHARRKQRAAALRTRHAGQPPTYGPPPTYQSLWGSWRRLERPRQTSWRHGRAELSAPTRCPRA
mmetsp:Transcript_28397/g.72737  ORF Transcript_28397/g.72737 Transcript_28397/m.72737 type:complete len:277 (-) Transcript_28397:483-1313(-)